MNDLRCTATLFKFWKARQNRPHLRIRVCQFAADMNSSRLSLKILSTIGFAPRGCECPEFCITLSEDIILSENSPVGRHSVEL